MTQIFHDIPFHITASDIFALMYPACDRVPMKPARNRLSAHTDLITDQIAEIQKICRPQGIIRIVDRNVFTDWSYVSHCERIIVGIVTLGQAFDQESSRLQRAGSMLESFLFDTVGSAAIESVCDVIDRNAWEAAKLQSRNRTPRISPGYGDFHLSNQQYIFRLLPARDIGVSLTNRFMMQPNKSISFVFAVGSNPVLPGADDPCRACSINNCRYRKKTPVLHNSGIATTVS